MGRLLSFLGCAAATAYLAGAFQIPNFLPIMLLVYWIGMGAGLKLGYAIAGAALIPFAAALPMWFLPGPNELHRVYPADDSLLFEVFAVEGAVERYEEQHAEYETSMAAAAESVVVDRPAEEPTLFDSNVVVLQEMASEGHGKPAFNIWPTPMAWILGFILTLGSFAINTLTTKPFRDPEPLGAA